MRYVALLRAVNLAGHNRVGMSDLRELVTKLGFDDARSILQSGNIVFSGAKRSTAEVERQLEKEAAKRLGLETVFFVRTDDEWKAIIEKNPFRSEAKKDPGLLVVLFLKDEPSDIKPLQEAITGREIVRAGGRQIYAVYPDGQGRSRLTNALIEKKLGTRATARNWNTVLKLA
jgi:uncharacterized protein (DUF1697 family)